ncbi:(Fe-S)-binding protein [Paenibacillus koleovorans]|uniref:(Fe-S)-binding protein n=1 Tax=Paenibacillus koleovorans TaxID=121608 RepID=UPI000FDB02EA|nr:(Fe-S)-binding protein [Paenibacillus koleovorans]
MSQTDDSAKKSKLAYDATNMCIQCGYCLPACPTYASMGTESASPRGRINLVRLAAEGKISISEDLAKPIDLCLGCRACEPACPVNVPYGRILEAAKEAIQTSKSEKQAFSLGDQVEGLALTQLFPFPRRLKIVGNAVWFYQAIGLDRLVRSSGILNKISPKLAQFERVLPRLERPIRRTKWGRLILAKGETKRRVAFFAGCIMDALMNRTNRLTIELLTSVGCEVIIPEQQRCCGALHAHQGKMEEARTLARANIAAFEESGSSWYIHNAGGCGALLGEYDHLLAEDEAWAQRAKQFSAKSKDISEILVEMGPLPFDKQYDGGRVTYQDSCHLRNVQHISKEPRLLLQSIPGAHFVEMEDSASCCASGGIYNLTHYEQSMQILDAKMEKAANTKATTIVSGNPGCLLQLRIGIDRQGASGSIRALHLVEVLAEACGLDK